MKRFTLGILFLVFTLSLTSAAFARDHTVISNNPFYVSDAQLMVSFLASGGHATVSWKENSPYAFLSAKVRAGGYTYELICTSAYGSTNDDFRGYFNIFRDGVLVANNILGTVYGLSQPAGGTNVFRFDAAHSTWSFGFYLDIRYDW
jgi:hypothetical protein